MRREARETTGLYAWLDKRAAWISPVHAIAVLAAAAALQVAVSLLQRIAAQHDDLEMRGSSASATEALKATETHTSDDSKTTAAGDGADMRDPRIEQRPRGQTRRPHGHGAPAAPMAEIMTPIPEEGPVQAAKALPRTHGAVAESTREERVRSKMLDLDVQLLEREAWRMRQKAVHEAGPLRELKGGDVRSAGQIRSTAAR